MTIMQTRDIHSLLLCNTASDFPAACGFGNERAFSAHWPALRRIHTRVPVALALSIHVTWRSAGVESVGQDLVDVRFWI